MSTHHKRRSQFASVVVPITMDRRIIVVRDPKGRPPLWKFPGGHQEFGETPEECGVRELKEETGATTEVSNLKHIISQEKGAHTRRFFLAEGVCTENLKAIGDGNLEVKIALPHEILEMSDFVFDHLAAARNILDEIRFGIL